MDLAWNLESVSATVYLFVRLCHPKIAEFFNLEAAAPECGEYLLMVSDSWVTAGIVSCDQQHG